MKEIIADLVKIKTILIGTELFTIEFTHGGDLKWIALSNGINGANSSQPCPWCTWDKNDESYEIKERSLDQSKLKLQSPVGDNDGYIDKPLLDFIEFKNTMIDPLHLLLRITDKLFEKLLSHFEKLENKSLDLTKRPFLKRLNDLIETECGITSPFYLSKSQEHVKFRSLNQNERIKILKALEKKNLVKRFPELKDDDKILILNFVINKFYELFTYAKNDYNEIIRIYDRDLFKARLNEWHRIYLKMNDAEKITPYIHSFINHVPDVIEKHKNLNFFSTQALEKLNSVTKTNFFRSTNKKRNSFLKQLLEKANRIEFINLKGTTAELYEKINNL